MIVVDTTVLTYAVGTEHPLREPCRWIFDAQARAIIAAATTVEVIQEFAHVRARRRTRSDAAALARHYMAALTVLTTRSEDLDLGLALFERHPALGAFDATLAAVALNRGAEALISADRAFGDVPDLSWIDPATPALGRLLGH